MNNRIKYEYGDRKNVHQVNFLASTFSCDFFICLGNMDLVYLGNTAVRNIFFVAGKAFFLYVTSGIRQEYYAYKQKEFCRWNKVSILLLLGSFRRPPYIIQHLRNLYVQEVFQSYPRYSELFRNFLPIFKEKLPKFSSGSNFTPNSDSFQAHRLFNV